MDQPIALGRIPRRVPRRLLILLCAAGAVQCARNQTGPRDYQLNHWPLQVSLMPEKATVMAGEPIFLSFTIRNNSSDDLQLLVGGDTLNRLRRPDSFTVRVARRGGSQLPTPESPAAGGSSVRGPRRLPARGEYVFSLFLPDWVEFTEPGRYAITATRILEVGPHGQDVDWTEPGRLSRLAVEVTGEVTVIATDHTTLGEVIDARGRALFGSHEEEGRLAAKALAAIDDRRVMPHLLRAMDESPYSIRIVALRALGRFGDQAAVDALTRAADDPDLGIRLSAATALSRSPHPAALTALIARRHSDDVGVRLTVLQTLAAQPSPESLELIREMTGDPDEDVRTEAQRYVRQRAAAGRRP